MNNGSVEFFKSKRSHQGLTMGNWFSSNENKDVKLDGQVNNNVMIEEQPGGRYDDVMLILTAIICAIKVFEFVVYVYKKHTKFVKDRHERNLVIGDIKK